MNRRAGKGWARFGLITARPKRVQDRGSIRLYCSLMPAGRITPAHVRYHRVFGAKQAGATDVPCVFRDAPDHEAGGFTGADLENGQIRFPVSLLTSDNPPTMAHFTHGRAHEVALRAKSRIIPPRSSPDLFGPAATARPAVQSRDVAAYGNGSAPTRGGIVHASWRQYLVYDE